MGNDIHTISLALPFGMGSVNSNLVHNERGFYLVDTGGPNATAKLERELELAGCTPGLLKLIVITHGDFDHIGNAARMRARFGAPIAMHKNDAGMAERADMLASRKSGSKVMAWIVPRLFGFGQDRRFTPDVLLGDGTDLTTYGWEAKVVALPGHSGGSIGVVTAEGDLFCGDLLENTKNPVMGSIVDDRQEMMASVRRLTGAGIRKIYPGHGSPFGFDRLGGGAG